MSSVLCSVLCALHATCSAYLLLYLLQVGQCPDLIDLCHLCVLHAVQYTPPAISPGNGAVSRSHKPLSSLCATCCTIHTSCYISWKWGSVPISYTFVISACYMLYNTHLLLYLLEVGQCPDLIDLCHLCVLHAVQYTPPAISPGNGAVSRSHKPLSSLCATCCTIHTSCCISWKWGSVPIS